MHIKLGCSCYASDIDQGKTFYYCGSVFVMIQHDDDKCTVREVAVRGEADMITFVIRENTAFNSYADVKPFTIEG